MILQAYSVIRPFCDQKPDWWEYLSGNFYESWASVQLAVDKWIGVVGPVPSMGLEPGVIYYGPWFDAINGKNPFEATPPKRRRSSEYSDDRKGGKMKRQQNSGEGDEYSDAPHSQSSSEDDSQCVIPFGSRRTLFRQRLRPYKEIKRDNLDDIFIYAPPPLEQVTKLPLMATNEQKRGGKMTKEIPRTSPPSPSDSPSNRETTESIEMAPEMASTALVTSSASPPTTHALH
ncbi:hypothetical protein CPB86DRAFT_780075 [Serendipita vermifera]|nr:hypothetical protein CPB86DRAFT_780075 [Serendipita vermifera]